MAADLVLAPDDSQQHRTRRWRHLSDPPVADEDEAAADPRPPRQTNAFLTLVAYNGTVITSAMFLTAMVANPLVVQLAPTQGITITWSLWALRPSCPASSA